jgi:uncharacterized membrane-anchored protein
VYNEIGKNIGQLVFGSMVFLIHLVGYVVGLIGYLITSSFSSTPSPSLFSSLVFLSYFLPFAFAYDGYRRGKSVA